MAVLFTHRRMSPGGTRNEHITHVKWRQEHDGETGFMSKPQAVKWLDDGNRAFVQGPHSRVEVGVVREAGKEPYLRTHANGKWDDNLLSLPLF
ncbi:DUF3892 domain-containing protein [Nocardia farcinica]|nr:DUF3892 domain-containing protein [Nocardia farcinica]MBF6434402.1 DUF3892 domain-containing protein [Nocardia farcinica]MBF6505480.1 DUF3892 domain-containing protein [Nocardia farcinica]